jgi:hypothetical protein
MMLTCHIINWIKNWIQCDLEFVNDKTIMFASVKMKLDVETHDPTCQMFTKHIFQGSQAVVYIKELKVHTCKGQLLPHQGARILGIWNALGILVFLQIGLAIFCHT